MSFASWRAHTQHAVALLWVAGTLAVVGLRAWPTRTLPLTWDEVDYAQAARYGALRNACGGQELDLLQFARLALSKRGSPLITQGFIDEARETFFLRHFHPPLPVYYWSRFQDPDPDVYRSRLRSGQLLLCCLALLACAVAFLAAAPPRSRPLGLALLPFLASGSAPMDAFSALNFHGPFLVAAVLLVGLTVGFVAKPTAGRAALVGAAAAVCLTTLETAVVVLLLVAAAACGTGGAAALRRHAGVVTGTLLAALLLLWPGILVTGGPVKSWAMYAYRVFFAGNREYERVAPVAFWTREWSANLGLLALVLAALVLALRTRGHARRAAIPALVGLGYGVFMTPFALAPSYVSLVLALLWLAAALLISEAVSGMESAPRVLVYLCSLVVAAVSLWSGLTRYQAAATASLRQADDYRAELQQLGNRADGDPRPFLLYGGHIAEFYLGGPGSRRIERLHVKDEKDPGFWVRRNYAFESVSGQVRSGRYGCVGLWRIRPFTPSLLNQLVHWGAEVGELGSYTLACFPPAGAGVRPSSPGPLGQPVP